MVIQGNMPVSGIVAAWEVTEGIFTKYRIPIDTNRAIEEIASGEKLDLLLNDLNEAIGSSELTCIAGG